MEAPLDVIMVDLGLNAENVEALLYVSMVAEGLYANIVKEAPYANTVGAGQLVKSVRKEDK